MTIEINFSEKDIEDFLCSKQNLEYYLDLRFIDRQVKIYNQSIDILAYSKYERAFYVIELKRNELDAKALAQAIKYVNLLRVKYKGKHDFKILLIGANLSPDLFYCVTYYRQAELNSHINYALFGYDFASGIDFNYCNGAQRDLEEELRGGYEK